MTRLNNNKAKLLASVVILVSVLVVVLVVSKQMTTSTLALSPAQLSEIELHSIALQRAQAAGLQGNPSYEEYHFMSLGEWYTRIRVGTPYQVGTMTRASQIYVYMATGNIPTVSMPGYRDPSVVYDTLVITLNPQDGTLITISAYPPGTSPNFKSRIADEGTPSFIPTIAPDEPGSD